MRTEEHLRWWTTCLLLTKCWPHGCLEVVHGIHMHVHELSSNLLDGEGPAFPRPWHLSGRITGGDVLGAICTAKDTLSSSPKLIAPNSPCIRLGSFVAINNAQGKPCLHHLGVSQCSLGGFEAPHNQGCVPRLLSLTNENCASRAWVTGCTQSVPLYMAGVPTFSCANVFRSVGQHIGLTACLHYVLYCGTLRSYSWLLPPPVVAMRGW